MIPFRYFVINIIGTLLRGFPLPTKTGLIKIGNPDSSSPVFLTCNYSVTVERVKRALKGLNCYLLVSNSHGINVWCASAGGHLSNHSVISSLKTSGIENLVEHREIILPQLAASGVEAITIRRETRWNVKWGPVYAKDIPEFLRANYQKNRSMRTVNFPLLQRLEMAVMWAFPFSVVFAILTSLFWRDMLAFTVSVSWIIPLVIFLSFPIYSGFLGGKKSRTKEPGFSKYTVFFSISWISVALWIIFMGGVYLYTSVLGIFSLALFIKWAIISFIMTLLVNIDLMGSTPIYKSGLHEERLLRVGLDEEKCNGCGVCFLVCPRDCFVRESPVKGFSVEDSSLPKKETVSIPGADRCVRCGACIVQCPSDALCFFSDTGQSIMPEIIRKYKLNMMGKRLGA